ncbi:metal-dependent hydrolase [Candidatus Albibeggiatoa sp. nov. NOAA]|uniref:metal-dependent hydrolase n=1 Tax=Candidatus Albibeggiatoa sp. nov. NOAA TaxID=3162724 RepID=UPI003304C227|nr:metal-dependent hydrolase [Thiotrichaceae bacterium]
MANFKTHISVAAVGSGLLSTMFLGAGMASPKDVVILAVVGTIGGILPDIDLDHSSPTKIMFTSLAIIFAFLVMFNKASTYSIIELWLIWGASFALVRYLAWQIFADLTKHRGIIHSLFAAMFFWFFTTSLCYHVFDYSQTLSWMVGFFVFYGFIIHLCLDEFYSVDFTNKRLKQSFGTALKIYDYKNYQTSAMMFVAMTLAFLMTPNADSFLQLVGSSQTYSNIWSSFFPSGMWFSL